MTNERATAGGTDPLGHDEDWIEYTVGDPNERGRTEVRVEGSGKTTVTREHRGSVERYTATLPADLLDELRETLGANDPRSFPDTDRDPVADEALIRIRGRITGEQFRREFWANETAEIPGLDEVVRTFKTVATTVSDGDVQY